MRRPTAALIVCAASALLALVVAVASGSALSVSEATTRITAWYWSQGAARYTLVHSRWGVVRDIQGATCRGLGPSIPGKKGARLYTRFGCDVYAPQLICGPKSSFPSVRCPPGPVVAWSGRNYATLYVTGRDSFRVVKRT